MEPASETSSDSLETTGPNALVLHLQLLAQIARTNASHNPEMSSWRYTSFAELLLHRGRLFTPAAASVSPAPPKNCFTNAAVLAVDAGIVYVEGVALSRSGSSLVLPHAWCARDFEAFDPTWPDGQAYLGLPLLAEFCQARSRSRADGSLLSLPEGVDLLRDGLPQHALADIGFALHR